MSKFFINRPIVAMVISIIMVIVGLVTLFGLPVAQFPKVVPPEIYISATYVGADAQTIEQSVATPIEQQMSGVDNMNYMYSINANDGTMRIFVNFNLATDPNIDHVLTQLRYAQAESQLPADVRNYGVTVQKSLSAPFIIIALNSPKGTHDADFLANYAYINLSDALSRVPGISQVQIFGAGQYAMRIWVKPDQLAKLNITVPEIINAVSSQNNVNPAGKIGGRPSPPGQEFTYTVRAQGRLTSAEEFGDVVLRATPDGSIVRLKDVARIELGAADYDVIGRFNGKPTAVLALYQLPGSNAIEAASGVRKLMAELKGRFPPDLDYQIPIDTTKAVTEGIREIGTTFWEALALVMIVVFVFLQGWRAALIPLLAVPVSLIATFAMFPLLGFSINTLSLFGLVLAIGLVVDDAIVVVEAVEHHIQHGLSPKEASFKAMEEVASPVIGIAVILSAVFIPTAFIPGITGRLYQQFAVTIAVSVLISAFNALTLSPALSALLLRPKKPARGPLGRFFEWFNRVFGRATDGYVRWCGVLIHKMGFSLIILLGFTVLAAWFGMKLPTSFLPDEDQGYVFVALQLPDASSLQRTSLTAKKVEDILLKTAGIDHVTSVVGYNMISGAQNTFSSFFWVTLKEWGERKTPEEQYDAIRAHVNKELRQLPAGVSIAFSPPAIPGVGTSGGVTFMLEDRAGRDVAYLAKNVDTFMVAARKRPELASVFTTMLPSVPQVFVNVQRDKVLAQGVNLGDVYKTLQAFMGGAFINYFNRFGRQWKVYIQAEGDYRTRAENLGQFYVRNNIGNMVPLSAVISIDRRVGPEFTLRYNLFRCAQINASANTGYSSAQAMTAMEEVFAQTMPPDMGFDYLGMSYQEKRAQQGVPPAVIFGFSFLFCFLILAALYESWTLPFSVLLSVPIAVFGAFATLYLRRFASFSFDHNVHALIGLIVVLGLAGKIVILIVEFAKAGHEHGKSLLDAALEGAKLRLRPILMTSLAFILGCVPLWRASGSGSVSRQVMGTAVVGGMTAASAIAIFIIPALFYLVEKLGGTKHEANLPISATPEPGHAAGDD